MRDQIVVRTFDFSKMYTNIELDDLKNKLPILIDQLLNFKQSTSRNRFFSVHRDGFKESCWTRNAFDDSKKRKCIDASTLKRYLHFLVDNMFEF